MESFFAEALDKQDEITFKRSHQYTYEMSEIAYTNHNYLNLSVTKDGQWQYVLLGMDDRSGYGFDIYDCHKMFGNNENMPDIYLKDAQDEYSVCVFPDYPAVYDVGMYIGNDSDVEMDLNNLSVLPGYTAVFMEDKISREFYDLCNMGNIKVHLNKGTTERFRLHILKSYDIRGEGNYESGVFFWADKERLLFYCDMTDVKVERIKITQNGKIVFEGEYDAGQVMSYELKKGNYELHLFYGNKWQNVIKAEI